MLFKHDTLKSLKLDYIENSLGNAGATFISDAIL